MQIAEKLILAAITAALGVLAIVVPAFASIDPNHNEIFLREGS